jgi:hypothetical protein
LLQKLSKIALTLIQESLKIALTLLQRGVRRYMFYRNIIDELKEWARQESRKPLILRGARQVGKTTAINIFSKDFENYIYLNLELKKDSELFDNNLKVSDLIQLITLAKNIQLKKGRTLIFIDEIQNNPNALEIMRYFYEDLPEFYIIGAGSMLEIMMGENQISFPVGRVEYRFMYPLNFKEFLIASGNKQSIDLYNQLPIPNFAIKEMLDLFQKYTMIGGMPEIVKNYFLLNDVNKLNIYYESLLTSYNDDISKYTDNRAMNNIIKHTTEAIPSEAGKRIKFQGFGNSNYKSREISEALKILERAMLIKLIYPTTNTALPIIANKKKSPKLQYLDTGLLNYSLGLQSYFFSNDNLHSFYEGILAEHIVTQEFLAKSVRFKSNIHFWVRELKQSNAEVDFVIQYKTYLIPIEVKSGKSGTLRSLHQFINTSEHNYAVRLYSGDLIIQETKTPSGKPYKLLNLPYFLAGKIDEYIEWFIMKDNNANSVL